MTPDDDPSPELGYPTHLDHVFHKNVDKRDVSLFCFPGAGATQTSTTNTMAWN